MYKDIDKTESSSNSISFNYDLTDKILVLSLQETKKNMLMFKEELHA